MSDPHHYAVGLRADQLSERITATDPASAAEHWMRHYRRHRSAAVLFVQRMDGTATVGPVVEIAVRVEVTTEVRAIRAAGRLASSRGRVEQEARCG